MFVLVASNAALGRKSLRDTGLVRDQPPTADQRALVERNRELALERKRLREVALERELEELMLDGARTFLEGPFDEDPFGHNCSKSSPGSAPKRPRWEDAPPVPMLHDGA